MAVADGGAAQVFIRRATPSFESLRSINLSSFRTTSLVAPFTSSALEICPPPQAVKGEVDVLLKGVVDKDTVEDVKRILEMANRASLRREILHTDFLTPPVLKESMLALEKIADIKMVAQGGYPEAERCRLSVGHPDILTSDPDIVAALSISGNFGFETCSHGDFLGSILGTGIVRDKLGDILLQGEKGAQFLVVPELVDFLVSSLNKVRNIPVTCKKIPLHALKYQPPRTKSFETVEKSLQLEASAGPKTVGVISDEGMRVNGVLAARCHMTLNMGDILSVNFNTRVKSGTVRRRTAHAMMEKRTRTRTRKLTIKR